MGKQNYTGEDLKTTLNTEVDIAALIDDIFEKKLYHPDAPINEYLLDGSIDFNFDVKSTRTHMICPFHKTKNDDSTYSYHEGSLANHLSCESGSCPTHGKPVSPINAYMALVKNVSFDLMFESTEEFKETMKEMAEMHGITWSYETRQLTDEEKKEMKKQRIRQEVTEIYHREFMKNNRWAKKARKFFFYERGFGQLGFSIRSLIRKHKIGYAGGGYGSKFIYNIMKKKYTDEELLYAGVVQYKKTQEKTGNKSVYSDEIIDFLTNRLTLPYHKTSSKIDHGYGRRIEFKEQLKKMYENMTEEQIKRHKRGKHLRFTGGVDEPINFQEAKKYESLIIVEGEMDFLTFSALGFPNVIAVGGTNGLEKEDIAKLKYWREKSKRTKCKRIYFCFDEDIAGQKAMLHLGETLVEEGFDVRIMRLTDGDPNDYLMKHGKQAKEKLQLLMDESISFEAFSVLYLLKASTLKTHADVNGFLIAAKEHLEAIHPLQRLPLAGDLVEGINAYLPADKQYKLEWVLYAWGIIPQEMSQPDTIGFEQAVSRPWVLVTDKKERYDAILNNGVITNVVYVANMTVFVDQIKQVEHIKQLAFDSSMEKENKRTLLVSLQDYRFREFVAPSTESIESASRFEFLAFFREFELPHTRIG